MAFWHLRSKRKPTGGLLSRNRKKKKRDRGSQFLEPLIEEHEIKAVRGHGGNVKSRLVSAQFANVADKKTGKIEKTKILSVKDNKANLHFVRRNVLTKGSVIQTEKGLAKITSRPTQDGIVNAVLVENK